MISIEGPKCQHFATVPDNAAGMRVRCKCGHSFVIQTAAKQDTPLTLDFEWSERKLPSVQANSKPKQNGLVVATLGFLILIIVCLTVIGSITNQATNNSGAAPAQPPAVQPVAPATQESSAYDIPLPNAAGQASLSEKDQRVASELLDQFATGFERTNAYLIQQQYRAVAYVLSMLYCVQGRAKLNKAFGSLLTLGMKSPECFDCIAQVSFAAMRDSEKRKMVNDRLHVANISMEDHETFVAVWGAYSLANQKCQDKGTTLDALVAQYCTAP